MEKLIHAAIVANDGVASTDAIRDEVEPYGWGLSNSKGDPLACVSGRNTPFFTIISLLHSRALKVGENMWSLRPQDEPPAQEEVERIRRDALRRIEERRLNGEELFQERCA